MIINPDKSYSNQIIHLRGKYKVEDLKYTQHNREYSCGSHNDQEVKNQSSAPKLPIEITLELNKDEIKGFHLMIQIINMFGIPFGKKIKHKTKQFKEVSDKMIEYGYKAWKPGFCFNNFHKWAAFYAKVLNIKLI
jgi:hypothetical protein